MPDELQVERAEKGNVVICGKLSIHFLKDLCKNKIWVFADVGNRAKRAAVRGRISAEEATKILVERENAERREWKKCREWKNMYAFDYVDLKIFADFVFDNSRLTPENSTYTRKICEKSHGIFEGKI